jgi:hypothetical protein
MLQQKYHQRVGDTIELNALVATSVPSSRIVDDLISDLQTGINFNCCANVRYAPKRTIAAGLRADLLE